MSDLAERISQKREQLIWASQELRKAEDLFHALANEMDELRKEIATKKSIEEWVNG